MRKWGILVTVAGLFILILSANVFAAEGGTEKLNMMGAGLALLGAGVAIGFAALGGGIGQGLTAGGALLGIARNPGASDKMFVPMILGLALIESLVLYAFVISFFLLGKV